jgi:hypothetical protein
VRLLTGQEVVQDGVQWWVFVNVMMSYESHESREFLDQLENYF